MVKIIAIDRGYQGISVVIENALGICTQISSLVITIEWVGSVAK